MHKYFLITIMFFKMSCFCVFGQNEANQNDPHLIFQKPIFYLDMEYYRDSSITYKSKSQDPFCQVLFEVKNPFSNIFLSVLLQLDSGRGALLDIPPISSSFVESFIVLYTPIELSPLLVALFTKSEFKILKNDTQHSRLRYDFVLKGKTYTEILPNLMNRTLQGLEFDDNMIFDNSRFHGTFRYSGALKDSHLFAIDTLVNLEDTSKLKKKYDIYHVIDNFYVLNDRQHQNDLLAQCYTRLWKATKVPIEKINVQYEFFSYQMKSIKYYPEIKKRYLNLFSEDSIVKATIKIRNNSDDYVYVRKQLENNENKSFAIRYFSQERKKENETIKALSPGASLITTLYVDAAHFKKIGYVDLDLSAIFMNCEKKIERIYFTPGYLNDQNKY